ncbi:MAG: CBS domain-containing protein [Hyphomicrobiales bacterium]|nr:CBS domain-containing protein [Hyphomicrobiales bacterium]
MPSRPRICDYMATKLVTLPPDMEINEAMVVLLEGRFSGAPVVNATGELVGVLSKKDCFRSALHASYHEKPGGLVADYMSRDIETLDADMEIYKVAEAFLKSPFRRFPVLREGRLVGQISRADLLRALVEQW